MSGDPQSAAERFIRDIPIHCKVIILYHGDADGVCSAVMIYRCLRYRGLTDVSAFPLGRGENPFSKMTIETLQNETPDYLIVLDSGSRKGTFQNMRCRFGHSKATGGIVKKEVFRDFLKRLGFEPAIMA